MATASTVNHPNAIETADANTLDTSKPIRISFVLKICIVHDSHLVTIAFPGHQTKALRESVPQGPSGVNHDAPLSKLSIMDIVSTTFPDRRANHAYLAGR